MIDSLRVLEENALSPAGGLDVYPFLKVGEALGYIEELHEEGIPCEAETSELGEFAEEGLQHEVVGEDLPEHTEGGLVDKRVRRVDHSDELFDPPR